MSTNNNTSNSPTKFDLAQYDDQFQQTEMAASQYDKVPDGKYEALVDKVELVSTKDGKPRFVWHLKITAPTQEGRFVFRSNLFATPDNLKWLKTDLHTAGLDLDKLSDLPTRMGELLDTVVAITVKTAPDGQNQNVYINKRLGKTEGMASAGPVQGDKALPF